MDFSGHYTLFELNGFYSSNGVRGMLEGKTIVHYTWYFLTALIYQATGVPRNLLVTGRHTLYSDRISSLTGCKSGE